MHQPIRPGVLGRPTPNLPQRRGTANVRVRLAEPSRTAEALGIVPEVELSISDLTNSSAYAAAFAGTKSMTVRVKRVLAGSLTLEFTSVGDCTVPMTGDELLTVLQVAVVDSKGVALVTDFEFVTSSVAPRPLLPPGGGATMVRLSRARHARLPIQHLR